MRPVSTRMNPVSRYAAAILPHGGMRSAFSARVKSACGWLRKRRWWAPGRTSCGTTGSYGRPSWRKSSAFLPNRQMGPLRHSSSLIHRDDRKCVREVFARCKQDQALFETEFRYSHGAEETRWMLVRPRISGRCRKAVAAGRNRDRRHGPETHGGKAAAHAAAGEPGHSRRRHRARLQQSAGVDHG